MVIILAKKTIKKKINKKGVLVVVLSIYLIIMAFYYCFTLPVKTILITGNKYISDQEIITASGINESTKLLFSNKKNISNNIKKISLIEDVNIQKSLNGKVTINVQEAQVLFINILNKTYVLSNQKETECTENYLGIPVLINYVPSDIYKNLITKMSKIDSHILTLISEIKYDPNIKDNIPIDNNRFLLKMNDGNYVYINLANFENLGRYESIYATLDDTKKGILNLDSSSQAVLFKTFEAYKKEVESD